METEWCRAEKKNIHAASGLDKKLRNATCIHSAASRARDAINRLKKGKPREQIKLNPAGGQEKNEESKKYENFPKGGRLIFTLKSPSNCWAQGSQAADSRIQHQANKQKNKQNTMPSSDREK